MISVIQQHKVIFNSATLRFIPQDAQLYGHAAYLFLYYHWADGDVKTGDLAREFGKNESWISELLSGSKTGSQRTLEATLTTITGRNTALRHQFHNLMKAIQRKGGEDYLEKVYAGLDHEIMRQSEHDFIAIYGNGIPTRQLKDYRIKHDTNIHNGVKYGVALKRIALIAQSFSPTANHYGDNRILLGTLDLFAERAPKTKRAAPRPSLATARKRARATAA